MTIRTPFVRPFASALLLALCGVAAASPAPFNYLGELHDGAAPANGVYDLEFALFTAGTGGAQIGQTLCFNDVAITDGRVSLVLDFSQPFNSEQRYLAIFARADSTRALECGASTGFEQVGPRVALESTPVALYAPQALDAANATTAATVGTAAGAQKLGGQPASYYTNAAHLTGTLPSSAITGAYSGPISLTNPANVLAGNGAGLTGITVSQAQSAAVADTSTSADDSDKLNGQPASYYLNAANLTGTVAYQAGTFNQPVQLTSTANVYYGSAANLTKLNASSFTAGFVSDGHISGEYPQQVNISGNSDYFYGDGSQLSVNAANFENQFSFNILDLAKTPRLGETASSMTWGPSSTWVYAGTAFADFNGYSSSTNLDFGGTLVIVWNVSGWTDAANTQFLVAPFLDGVQQGISVPFDINSSYVHQCAMGSIAIPNVGAGPHTVSVRIAKRVNSFGNGNFRADNADTVNWSLFVVR